MKAELHRVAGLLRGQRLQQLQAAAGRSAQHLLHRLHQRLPLHDLADGQLRRPVAGFACSGTVKMDQLR